MAKSTVISIEPRNKTIHCYSSVDSKRIKHAFTTFEGQFFDGNFSMQFLKALDELGKACPIATNNINIVLPNSAVMIDFFDIPTLNAAATKNNINLTANALYKNFSQLKYYYFPIKQDKITSTYCLSGVKGDILNALKAACLSRKFQIKSITFNAQSILNSAMIFHPKMKTSACIIIDIKDKFTTYVFGINGKAVGYYSLPFGLDVLNSAKVVSENTLHKHDVAEKIINEEKSHTVRRDEDDEENESDGDNDFMEKLAKELEDGKYSEGSESKVTESKVLPDYLQRPAPRTKAELICENFRIFVKWALLLNRHVNKFKANFKPRAVYVNMPNELGFLYNMVNVEKADNGILFAPVCPIREKSAISSDIELYGALNAKQHINKELDFLY